MKLSCPECASHIPSEDINIVEMVAKCAACDAVFAFGDHIRSAADATTLTNYEFDSPRGLSLDVEDGVLTLSRQWFLGRRCRFGIRYRMGCVPRRLVCDGEQYARTHEHIVYTFPLIHVGVRIGITYTALTKVFNRTKIRVDGQRITVKHGPFKWVGESEVHVTAIEQLYVHEIEPKLKQARGKIANYEVHALLKGGGNIRVIKGLKSPFQALYIEQEIERHLGISPTRVPGEYSPAPHEILVGRKRQEAGSLSIAQDDSGTLSSLGETRFQMGLLKRATEP